MQPCASFIPNQCSTFNFRYFAGAPHVAGSEENYQRALEIQKRFVEYGFDKVEIKKYNVLLSIPGLPGSVTLTEESGTELFRSRSFEKILDPAENMTNVQPPFNAFSPSGIVKVNYYPLGFFSSSFPRVKMKRFLSLRMRARQNLMCYKTRKRGKHNVVFVVFLFDGC